LKAYLPGSSPAFSSSPYVLPEAALSASALARPSAMYFLAAASSSLISLYLAFVRYLPTALPYSFFIFLLSPAWQTLHLASLNAAFFSPSLYLAIHSLLNGGSADALCMLQAIPIRQTTTQMQTFFILDSPANQL